jgi:hypothetical protein
MQFKTRGCGPRKIPEAKRVLVIPPTNLQKLSAYIRQEAYSFYTSSTPDIKYAKHLYSIADALDRQKDEPKLILTVKQAGNLKVFQKKHEELLKRPNLF